MLFSVILKSLDNFYFLFHKLPTTFTLQPKTNLKVKNPSTFTAPKEDDKMRKIKIKKNIILKPINRSAQNLKFALYK